MPGRCGRCAPWNRPRIGRICQFVITLRKRLLSSSKSAYAVATVGPAPVWSSSAMRRRASSARPASVVPNPQMSAKRTRWIRPLASKSSSSSSVTAGCQPKSPGHRSTVSHTENPDRMEYEQVGWDG